MTTVDNNQDPTQVFANGLLHLLEPVVFECDTQMQAVFNSQKDLSDQIDKLAAELEKVVSVSQSPSPSLVQPVQTLIKYVKEVHSQTNISFRSKQRLQTINSTLSTIKDRLDRMERLAADQTPTAAIPKVPDVLSSLFGRPKSAQGQQTQQTQLPQQIGSLDEPTTTSSPTSQQTETTTAPGETEQKQQ